MERMPARRDTVMEEQSVPYLALRCPICGSGPAPEMIQFDPGAAELSKEPGELFLIPRHPYGDLNLAVHFQCTQGHTINLNARFEDSAWVITANEA
jgi:hypothetical protein